jgi:hypothetical protein
VVLCAACQETAHIDLRLLPTFDGQCTSPSAGNPPPPQSCTALTLDCATHLQMRVRRYQNGAATDIIGSSCVSIDAVGRPRNFCDLATLAQPVPLVESVPFGSEIVLQLRGLLLVDLNGGCDNEDVEPIRIFSGVSDPIAIDGKDHVTPLHLSSCGSCADLPGNVAPAADMVAANPPYDLSASLGDLGIIADGGAPDLAPPDLAPPDLLPPPDLAMPVCPPGQLESPYFPYGARCCPVLPPSQCAAPGSLCPDGTTALLPPGGCCAVCD